MDKNDSISFMVFSRRALGQAFAKEVLFPFLGSKEPNQTRRKRRNESEKKKGREEGGVFGVLFLCFFWKWGGN